MRAFVIGGSGVVGRAICRRLVSTGWEVDIVGRDAARLPADLATSGTGFVAADRDDATGLAAAFGGGADLLVDCACFTRAQAETLVPLARNATATVMLSSKAVYVDAAGRHANSDDPPHYDGPIPETQPTLAPGDMDFRSREGYGSNKVAAERALLDSGLPVTVLRASKVHGEGARPPREWVFVKRVLDRRRSVLLAHRGRGVDHPSAAVNIAALVETVAHKGGQRILNCADPDAPSGADIAGIIARHLAHEWEQVLLDDDADPSLGWHPWDSPSPVILDTGAAIDLGYRPVGDYQSTVVDTIDWLTRIATMTTDGARLPAGLADDFPDAFDYAQEGRFLRAR